ncbi:MAG TPA: CaiB/BaiF CoA-transferase family protein [Stellaceae bacterium]|jgi:alpha-methylacyl-CoA racemase|nr:CaiB/BaiF CoA-transferase family protein [Stellaceae bacterium]
MGPLAGFKIVEFAGIGPAPMCAMLLADLGAEVIRIDRLEASGLGVPSPERFKLLHRSRPSVAIDLKQEAGVALALRLAAKADALIEGFRPGVMERLGLGPEPCLKANPRLVYGRMTGWGQTGPLAPTAGHDLDYIALSGALHAIGRHGQKPTPPLNLIGDFGGGALYLAMGILAALLETGRSGKGQVVDAAMVEGAASLMTTFYGLYAGKQITLERGANFLDSGAHFYEVYECADGQFIAVAAIEPKFYAELLQRLEIDPATLPRQSDRAHWAEAKAALAAKFKTKNRDEWTSLFEGGDACVAPVLSLAEAPHHPQAVARDSFVSVDGVVQPAPAPRFSRTPSGPPTAPRAPDAAALHGWGIAAAEIERLRRGGIVG